MVLSLLKTHHTNNIIDREKCFLFYHEHEIKKNFGVPMKV